MKPFFRPLAVGLLLVAPASYGSDEVEEGRAGLIECEGDYARHLQGVCRDGEGGLFWSFTDELVKTDTTGKILKTVAVADHHGDLCFHEGRIFVAVNLGKFNDPKGNADSWVYVYDAGNLEELAKQPVPEVFHGAGGVDTRDGHFFVVGGLPDGVGENYVYEYDVRFRFVKRHVIASGWTKLGIQTAAWHDGSWWFGCYGSPAILLKTDENFLIEGRFDCNVSLGIVGFANGRFFVAEGPRTESGRHRGVLRIAEPDTEQGLRRK